MAIPNTDATKAFQLLAKQSLAKLEKAITDAKVKVYAHPELKKALTKSELDNLLTESTIVTIINPENQISDPFDLLDSALKVKSSAADWIGFTLAEKIVTIHLNPEKSIFLAAVDLSKCWEKEEILFWNAIRGAQPLMLFNNQSLAGLAYPFHKELINKIYNLAVGAKLPLYYQANAQLKQSAESIKLVSMGKVREQYPEIIINDQLQITNMVDTVLSLMLDQEGIEGLYLSYDMEVDEDELELEYQTIALFYTYRMFENEQLGIPLTWIKYDDLLEKLSKEERWYLRSLLATGIHNKLAEPTNWGRLMK